MRWFLLVLVAAMVACGEGEPTPTAGQLDRTAEAGGIRTLSPTVLPTAEVYVVGPGGLEEEIRSMYRCLEESGEYRAMVVGELSRATGFEEGEVQIVVWLALADEEEFVDMLVEEARREQDLGVVGVAMRSSYEGLCGGMDGEGGLGEADEGVVARARVLMGELYECMVELPEVEAEVRAAVGGESSDETWEQWMSDRNRMVGLLLLGMNQKGHLVEGSGGWEGLLEGGMQRCSG